MEAPTLSELFLAFRQATTSLFFERRGAGLFELAEFEDDLPLSLKRLRRKLGRGGARFSCLSTKEMGEVWVVPKRLRTAQDDESDAAIVRVGQYENDLAHDIDIQLRLTPSPEFAIIEVLYLWEFGALLDSLLSKNAVGYRLKLTDGGIDTTGRRLFEYWPKQYERYRKEPLKAARDILSLRRRGIVIRLRMII